MTETVIYECPKCGDRKLVEYPEGRMTKPPIVYCGCEGFVSMDVDYHSDGDAWVSG